MHSLWCQHDAILGPDDSPTDLGTSFSRPGLAGWAGPVIQTGPAGPDWADQADVANACRIAFCFAISLQAFLQASRGTAMVALRRMKAQAVEWKCDTPPQSYCSFRRQQGWRELQ
eukprot:gene11519-biopygen22894